MQFPTSGAMRYAYCALLRISQQVENTTIAFIVRDRGDHYLSTGIFPA